MAGFFDTDYNGFSLLNPTLLGLMQGLGAASAPSRLPVTSGSVWGNIAGGLAHGQKAGLEQRTGQEDLIAKAMQNALMRSQLGWYTGTGKTPTIEEILSGKLNIPAPDFGAMFGSSATNAPGATPTKPIPQTPPNIAGTPLSSPLSSPALASPAPAAMDALAQGGSPPVPTDVLASIGQPGPGAPGMPSTPPPVQLAQNTTSPSAIDIPQGLPPQAASAAKAATSGPELQPMSFNGAQQYLMGTKLFPAIASPVLTALAQAGLQPKGSAQQNLLMNEARKAAGLTQSFDLRSKAGHYEVNPVTGQPELKVYQPDLPTGMTLNQGPGGQLTSSFIPGALPGLGQEAYTKSGGAAAGALGPKLAEEFARPRELGPNTSLATAGGLPNLPGVPGVSGTGMQGGGGPQMLHQGINPMYETSVKGQVDSDKDRIDKVLQPAADKAGETQATAHLIGNLMDKVKTGWGAETRQDMARIGSALGMPDNAVKSITGMNPAAGDALRKQFLAQSAEAVRMMGAREPGSVISLFAKAYPNLETMPGATKLLENVLIMQGQHAKDQFAVAQDQHNQAVEGMRSGGSYQPMTNFTADFAAGPHNTLNYLRGAQAMSKDPAAWQGVDPATQNQIIALIPKGTEFMAPDGSTRRKP